MRQTKVLVPPPSASLYIPRTRLDELSGGIVSRAVTIVRAGGGFGKTTLLRSWAAQVRDVARVGWLTLEPFDATATAMVEGITASLRHAIPEVGATVTQLLDRGDEDVRRLISAISNDLLAWTTANAEDVVLFIDDVQFVSDNPAALAVLSDLVSALPDRVHLVFATRTPLRFAPLAKLRAAGRLFDLDEAELRFTTEETQRLLSDDRAAPLYQERTDGWPIALALLAQVHQRAPDRPEVVLSGSRESLFQFLAEEVTGRLEPELVDQLYVLAIPESIDGDIACALLDVPRVETIISNLSRAGVYFGRVDDESWRLHTLFREFLIDRLRNEDPERLRASRLRYAELLRARGRKMEALHQLLDAQDYESIVEYSQEALMAIQFSDRFHQVIGMLTRVPEHVFHKNLILYRLFAKALIRDGKPDLAKEQLLKCYQHALATGDARNAFFAQLNLGINTPELLSFSRGEHLQSLVHFQRMLELAQSDALRDEPRFLMYAQWHLGIAAACRSDFVEAFNHLAIAEHIERALPRHIETVLVDISTFYGWTGAWRRSLEYAELAEELFRSGGGEAQLGRALAAQARAHIALRTQPERSATLLQEATLALRSAHQDEELPNVYALLARTNLLQVPPDIEQARAAIGQAERALARHPNRAYAFEIARASFETDVVAGVAVLDKERVSALRRIADANDDPWQQAIVHLCEAQRLAAGALLDEARDRYALASERLAALSDRYHAAVARAHVLAIDAKNGTLQTSDVEAFLASLREEPVEAAVRASGDASATLLEWMLRHDAIVEPAVPLLAESSGHRIDGLIDVAQDEAVSAKGRATALRALSQMAPQRARAIVARAVNDANDVIASTARVLLDFLPSPEAADIWVDVVGAVRVTIGAHVITEDDERLGRRKSAELLRYLAIADAPAPKGTIVAALWPDNPTLLDTTFRVTLHQLRRALQPDVEGSGDYIDYDGSAVRLRRATFAGTDAARGLQQLKQAQLAAVQDDLESAATLADDVITVFRRAPQEHDVDEWLRPHVRRWRTAAVQALRLRASIDTRRGDLRAAIELLETALGLDPLDEEVVTELLDALERTGRLDSARVTFEDYRRRLNDQLGAAPAAHLIERYGRIVSRTQPQNGRSLLSGRELEVVSMIARGKSNKQIAADLGLSVWTVNNHVAKILKKLNVDSRAGAVAASAGLLDG